MARQTVLYVGSAEGNVELKKRKEKKYQTNEWDLKGKKRKKTTIYKINTYLLMVYT